MWREAFGGGDGESIRFKGKKAKELRQLDDGQNLIAAFIGANWK
jgi:hypothetical protein